MEVEAELLVGKYRAEGFPSITTPGRSRFHSSTSSTLCSRSNEQRMADPLTSPLQNVPSPPVTPQRRRNDKSVAAVQLLPSPDLSPLPSSPTSGYIQANEFIQRIRRRELGRLLREQCAFLITPAEHNKALLQLREPGSRLRGYFQDKFRYDYDFRTGQLRICMPSYTHDAFLSIVVRVIDDYISKARSDGGAVQRFANDVMASGTADIEHYAPEDVEYKPMEHSDTEAPGSSADDNNSESLNPTITTRRAHQMSLRATHHELSEETHVLREIQNLTSVETETGNLASPSTASDTSNSRLRKKWSPDGSWKYAYDVTPKVVIEVAMSQPMEDLTRKAVSLIEECSAKVVLGFHLGMDNSQRTNTVATVTKWTSRQDSEGVIKASSVSRVTSSP